MPAIHHFGSIMWIHQVKITVMCPVNMEKIIQMGPVPML